MIRILVGQMAALCLAIPGAGWAQDSVTVSGVMGDKVLISVNGGPAKVIEAGASFQGVRVLAVRSDGAELQIDGRRILLPIGQGYYAETPRGGTAAATGPGARVVLTADGRGHFVAQGVVNGAPVHFLVDTGASQVVLPASVAKRAGVSMAGAVNARVATANGAVRAQHIVLDSVQVGGIRLYLVDALVLDDASLNVSLLGMSFLNRTNMVREGDTMVLTQRY
jgi:aspartyl protease family protein